MVLDQLENQSIYILREAYNKFDPLGDALEYRQRLHGPLNAAGNPSVTEKLCSGE